MAVWDNPDFLVGNDARLLFFESIFGLSIFLKFFCEFKTEESPLPVRDLSRIADRYLKGDFIFDVIPILPLPQYLILPLGS
jgi:hypothetical protein